MEEKKEEQKKENVLTVKIPKLKLPKVNFWMVSTLILLIFVGILFLRKCEIKETSTKAEVSTLTAEKAAEKCINYINNNLVQPGTKASIASVEEINGVYKVTTSYQGNQIPVYITKDGAYIFLQAFNTSVELPKPETQPQGEFDAPDRERPEVYLFVMSFCPFGMQAENAMKPVVDLLGNKATIKIIFIANVQGDTVESVRSLHGTNEAMEDLRQACIMKYYNQSTFWSYLMEINSKCASVYRDASALDTCWKNAAKKFGIDTEKIDSCSKSSDGLNLLKEHEKLTEKYGVSGSPTLIINDVKYSGARTPEAFKQAICSGFVSKPPECSKTLSSTSTTSGGNC
jgi:protein-disulfide isomerase